MKKHYVRKVLIHVFLVLFAFVMIYPLLWLFLSSFKANDEIFSIASILPEKFIWQNYVNGWYSIPEHNFGQFFLNTFRLVFLMVAGVLFSCSLAAYPFARLKFPLKKLLFAILMGTLMLPGQILLIPRYLLSTKLGWNNSILPLTVPAYLGQYNGAFFIFLMVQFLRGIPRELDESAVISGCGHFRIFWDILLPNCKPALFSVGIFTFIWSWDDFLQQLIYLNDVDKYTISLALRMFFDNTSQINWGEMFAMSILSITPCILIFFLAQKYLVEGIATTGLKG